MMQYRLDKIAHSDFVAALIFVLSPKEFSFHKVKSHRLAEEAVDFTDL